MTPPKPPVQDPVDISFENGITLTSTINPLTSRHSIQCNLCGATTDLGISASGSNISKHRDHEPCRRTAHKLRAQRARERIQVHMARSLLDMLQCLCFTFIRQILVHQRMVNWLVKYTYLSRQCVYYILFYLL